MRPGTLVSEPGIQSSNYNFVDFIYFFNISKSISLLATQKKSCVARCNAQRNANANALLTTVEKNENFRGRKNFRPKSRKFPAKSMWPDHARPRRYLCTSLQALPRVGEPRRVRFGAFSRSFRTEKNTVASNAPFSLRCALQRQRIRCNANAKNNARKQNFEQNFRQYPIFAGNCDVNTYDLY